MRYPDSLPAGGTIGCIAPSFGCNIEPYRSAFDNALKTVKLKGSDVKTLINLFTTSLNVTKDAINDEIYIDGVKLEMDKEYLVATIDYLFDKGTDQVTTGILFKDILVDRVEKDQTIK